MSRRGYVLAAAGTLCSMSIAALAVRHQRLCISRLEMEIRERRKADDATRKAKESAEAANCAKSDFLANMSHDIRTPMNAIIGLSENLLGADAEMSAECQRSVHIIHDEGQHLLRLINDILDISKVEAGEFKYEKTPFDLRNLVDEVVSVLSVRAHERELELKHEIAEDVPARLIGDAGCVRRILMNLVGNAVKFTEKGSVIIRVKNEPQEPLPGRISFSVQDTGIGIPPEQLGHIFERFSTGAASAIASGSRGTGLGLSIALKMAKGMGGTVWARSEPGRGSNFGFTLALEVAPETTESAAARQYERRVGAGFGKKRRSLRILMAEDNENNRLVVQAFLKNSDIQIDVAINGEEALRMFQAVEYDLVLMDIQMPVMDGLTATQEIRKWEALQGRSNVSGASDVLPGLLGVPIVALTAHALKADREKSLAAGCDGHMTKPINKRTLMRAVYHFTRNNDDLKNKKNNPEEQDSPRGPLTVSEDLQKIIPLLLENFRKSCLTMRDALATQDYKSVSKQAHNITGSGGTCGFPHISEIGRNIERAVQTGDAAGIGSELDDLSLTLDEIQVIGQQFQL